MPDFVHMHHDDVKACAEAPREAFDAVWAEKGWTEAEPHEDQTVLREELPDELNNDIPTNETEPAPKEKK